MKWSHAALLGAAVLGGATFEARGQASENTGSLSGTIRDSSDHPVSNAQVTVVHSVERVVTHVRTGTDGSFKIVGAPAGGPYTISVARLGFLPQTRDGIMAVAGGDVQTDFRLSRDETKLPPVSAEVHPSDAGGRNPLSAAEIATVNAKTALDALMMLRPRMLTVVSDICPTPDSLSLYVDGARRPGQDPPQPPAVAERMARDSSARAAMPASVARAMEALDVDVVRGGPSIAARRRLGLKLSEDYVREELSRISAFDVESVRFVSCTDLDPRLRVKSALIVQLKQF